jgi:1,4-dihydroxy-2-naphthoate octaprenyltransferase
VATVSEGAGTLESAAPSSARAWWLAARPQTLAAGVAPVLLGTALAAANGRARPGLAVAAVATALLLQIGANFANDLFDFEKGADTGERLGPARAVAAGWIAPARMRVGTALAFAAAAAMGSVLVVAGGWFFALLGVLAVVAGLAYTAGPWPLGYHGLGDVTVFVFFGLVAVAGSYALQAQELPLRVLATAVPSAALVTAILVVNNLRDVDTDARAGKRTLAVRLGRRATRAYYGGLLVLAYGALVGLVLEGALGLPALLPLLTLPAAFRAAGTVRADSDGPSLNRALAATARLHAAFTLLLALGVLA